MQKSLVDNDTNDRVGGGGKLSAAEVRSRADTIATLPSDIWALSLHVQNRGTVLHNRTIAFGISP